MLIRCNECGTAVDTKEGVCSRCGSNIYEYKTISIADSVVSIEEKAFDRWVECIDAGEYGYTLYNVLESITIPDSVTSIKSYAFENCNSLKSLHIPDTVTEIGQGAFLDCSSLKNIIIPSSVSIIESGTFSGCSSLENIILPNSVTEIGEHAFWNCTSLKAVIIPDTVTEIRRGAFSGCSSLRNIILPNSITCIEQDTFYRCTSLGSITIPNSVVSIEGYEDYDGYYSPFYGCNSLWTVIAPAKFKKEFSSKVTFISTLDNVNTQNFNNHREAPDGWGDLNPYDLDADDYEAWMDSFD